MIFSKLQNLNENKLRAYGCWLLVAQSKGFSGETIVRVCSISGIPQRSEDNQEACFGKKEIVR